MASGAARRPRTLNVPRRKRSSRYNASTTSRKSRAASGISSNVQRSTRRCVSRAPRSGRLTTQSAHRAASKAIGKARTLTRSRNEPGTLPDTSIKPDGTAAARRSRAPTSGPKWRGAPSKISPRSAAPDARRRRWPRESRPTNGRPRRPAPCRPPSRWRPGNRGAIDRHTRPTRSPVRRPPVVPTESGRPGPLRGGIAARHWPRGPGPRCRRT